MRGIRQAQTLFRRQARAAKHSPGVGVMRGKYPAFWRIDPETFTYSHEFPQ